MILYLLLKSNTNFSSEYLINSWHSKYTINFIFLFILFMFFYSCALYKIVGLIKTWREKSLDIKTKFSTPPRKLSVSSSNSNRHQITNNQLDKLDNNFEKALYKLQLSGEKSRPSRLKRLSMSEKNVVRNIDFKKELEEQLNINNKQQNNLSFSNEFFKFFIKNKN